MTDEFLDVYVAQMPPLLNIDLSKINHEARRAQIEGVRCEDLRREKFYAWLLLEKALAVRFGRGATELSLSREGGKWTSSHVFVSISHTENAVAVAISNVRVGVDIERQVPPRAKNFAKKTLSDSEMSELLARRESERGYELLKFWTKKEALFKAYGNGSFVPSAWDSVGEYKNLVECTEIMLGDESFYLSVASEISAKKKIQELNLTIE